MRRICPRCQTRYGDDVPLCPSDGSPLRADPFIGSRIDRWTLTDFVGQGAMGVVYAAEPTAAIKILNARRAAMQPDLVRRFEVEAQAASRFASPHIARVFASGTTEDGHLFIAMELLRGEPLDAILGRSPTLPPASAAAIGYQLAGALGEAHAAGVVHRDLKPANIFVEPAPGGGRHVRLLDFGVARINSESVARSRTGSVAGTPAFMSPEQLRGEPDIDGRSDVYSLGVVLYQLLSGVNPFRGSGGIMGTLRRHLELVPSPITGIPPVLDEVVRRMLAKHREARPQTMDATRQLLELTGFVSGADAATIPGMSREFLAAAGIYAAAPDPELRPLVKRLGPSPPPVPRATTPTPVKVDALPQPSITVDAKPPGSILAGLLPILVLVLVGVLAGVGFLWFQHQRGLEDSPGGDRPAGHEPVATAAPASEQNVEQPPIARTELMAAHQAMQAEKWRTARKAFEEVLRIAPGHSEALQGKAETISEANNQRLWSGLSEAVDQGRWDRALVSVEEFPPDSVYSKRAQALRPTIEAAYAQLKLNEGKRLLDHGTISGAEAIQSHLLTKPFAANAAIELAKAIEGERQAREARRSQRKSVAARPAKTADNRREQVAPRPRPTVVKAADASFDELVTQALRRMMKSDRVAAIVILKKAARKRPSSHLPHQRLCAIYKAEQQYKQALASCRKWLEREPNASYKPAIQRNIEQLQELINR